MVEKVALLPQRKFDCADAAVTKDKEDLAGQKSVTNANDKVLRR